MSVLEQTGAREIRDSRGNPTVGDEGGFAPDLLGTRSALDLITDAVTDAGFTVDRDIAFAVDVAATELYDDTGYRYEGATRSAAEMTETYRHLVANHPLVSIEDPLSEDGWVTLTAQLGSLTQVVAVAIAHSAGHRCLMSHRWGETEATTVAHLAVATGCGQIKTGAPARFERAANYNELLRIESALRDSINDL